MFVSIILPTWNRAHFLRDTIGSVLAQTYPNWELIVVDDGSTDNTAAVVAQYRDERIRYFKNIHTGYVGKVRNYGIQQAKGELIAFLDSDDQWKPDKLQHQTDLLRQHPDAGFVISNGEEFGPGSIQTPEYTALVVGDLFHPILLESQYCFYAPTFMFRQSLVQEIGLFDESVRAACDITYFFRMSARLPGIFTNAKLIRIRKHDSNLTKSHGTLSYDNTLRMLDDFRKDGTIDSREFKKLAAKTHYSIGLVHWRNKEYKLARKHFADSCLQRPFAAKPYARILASFLYDVKL